MKRIGVSAALALALWVGQAAAEEAPSLLDLLFETPHLESLDDAQEVVYRRTRESAEIFGLGEDIHETLRLTLAEDNMVAVQVTDAEGRESAMPPLYGLPGNPLLMVFLERVLRATAKATGGSPFYLRNRIREGLRDDLTRGEDGAIVLIPFAEDPNQGRMGPFGDLRMTFVIDAEAPGMIRLLRAEAVDYLEEIRLETP